MSQTDVKNAASDYNSSLVTILTPAYNRCAELENLFRSLCGQTQQCFDWLIVDDGSRDQTRETVQAWIQEAPFSIRYLYKENGGKHTALNLGISKIIAPLTFIVDSDDTLSKDAVETIRAYYEKYQPLPGPQSIGGLCFLRADSHGVVNAGEFPENETVADYCVSRINAGIEGDRAEVFLTDVLRKYPFPVFEGEKYMPEDAVWMRMSSDYKLVNINHVIYVCDYLDGGLTKTGRKMKIYSPYSMMYRSSVYLNDPRVNTKTRCKMMLLYRIYSHFAKEKDRKSGASEEEILERRGRVGIRKTALYLVMGLPALILYRRWKKLYQK